jgi:hypothetical protein
MKISRLFEIDYRHDRRAHRHRCRCCSKILNEGDRVLMARVGKGTVAIHIEHADEPNFPGSPMTHRQAMEQWSR